MTKAYVFIGQLAGNEALYTFLQECGFILVFKPTLERKVGNKTIVKGNVDAELVLHTMIHYRHYEQAIIVSGDGDFHCLIEYLANHQKLYRVLAPNRKYSGLLRKFYTYISLISSLKSSLELTKMTKISVRSKP